MSSLFRSSKNNNVISASLWINSSFFFSSPKQPQTSIFFPFRSFQSKPHQHKMHSYHSQKGSRKQAKMWVPQTPPTPTLCGQGTGWGNSFAPLASCDRVNTFNIIIWMSGPKNYISNLTENTSCGNHWRLPMTQLAADGGELGQSPAYLGDISGKRGLAPQSSLQWEICGVQRWCEESATVQQPKVSRCCRELQEQLKSEAIFASLHVPQC